MSYALSPTHFPSAAQTTTSTSTSLAPRLSTLEASLGNLRDLVTQQETTFSSSTEINTALIGQLRDNGKATNQAVELVKAKVEEVEKNAEARAEGLKKEVDELEGKAAKLQDEALKKADEVQAFASYFMTQ